MCTLVIKTGNGELHLKKSVIGKQYIWGGKLLSLQEWASPCLWRVVLRTLRSQTRSHNGRPPCLGTIADDFWCLHQRPFVLSHGWTQSPMVVPLSGQTSWDLLQQYLPHIRPCHRQTVHKHKLYHIDQRDISKLIK